MWEHITLPTGMRWNILVFIQKGNADTRVTSLLDVLQKVIKAVINTWVKTDVHFHDNLHAFCARQVTGTSIMDVKMDQDMSRIDQVPFFLLLLELRKAYDTLGHRHLLQTLEGYRAGQNYLSFLRSFWRTKRWSKRRVDTMDPNYGLPVAPLRGGCR